MRLTFIAVMIALISPSIASAEDAVWAIAGKEVLKLHASAGSITPQKRVEMMDARVTEMLSKGDGTLSASDINIREKGDAIVIVVREDTLVTVLTGDASAFHTTREKLAKEWLTSIRNTLPQLAPRVNKRGA